MASWHSLHCLVEAVPNSIAELLILNCGEIRSLNMLVDPDEADW